LRGAHSRDKRFEGEHKVGLFADGSPPTALDISLVV
jgi:hypothetical protein